LTAKLFHDPSISLSIKFGAHLYKKRELSPLDWFQNGGRHLLGFLQYVYRDNTTGCRIPFSAYVSNSVQI